MARSQNKFMKLQRERNKKKKQQAKEKKKLERKLNPSSGDLDDMLAYVDEFGNLSSEPPENQDIDEKEENSSSENKNSL